MKKHRVLKGILLVFVILFLVTAAGAWSMFGEKVRAARTVEKVEEGLYTMEYQGDYGFDEFLEQGGASSASDVADYLANFLSCGFWKAAPEEKNPYGCSTLTAVRTDGGTLFGRNFDWDDCSAIIVRTKPRDGYASIATSNLDFMGLGSGWKPEGIFQQYIALSAVYVPLDGMNEKGLCVADLMAGDQEETHQDTERTDLTTTTAIRLLLDRAATVEEAIALLEQYDMNSDIGTAHHLALADATGRSVVVEYIDGEMKVADTPVVTNFYLTPGEKYGTGSSGAWERYETLQELWEETKGTMTVEQVMEGLKAVAQDGSVPGDKTQWSIVFDTASQTADYYRQGRFDTPYHFSVGG